MVLSKLVPGLKNWGIEILATDVNTSSLHKASEGIYTDWSFRDTPSWVRRTFFQKAANGRWAVVPLIKKMVSFASLNLMDDAYPPLSSCPNGFDVIFCRNVLMYFTPEGMRKVIRQFHRYLGADGWLIVSATETSQELFTDFATVSFGDVTLYQKSDNRLPVALPLPVPDEHTSRIQQPAWIVETTGQLESSICDAEPEVQASRSVPVGAELPAASYAHALELYEQGDYEEAGRMTGALLLQNGSDARALFLRARIHANQGKLAEALGWCDKAIAADKMAAPAHYLRATILQEQGSIAQAILALKQAVYAEPQFVLAHFALGNLALKNGRVKESGKHFENALLLLAQYVSEDIVPESEGLSAGRLREMMAPPGTPGVSSQNRQHIRAAKPVGRLELSRR